MTTAIAPTAPAAPPPPAPPKGVVREARYVLTNIASNNNKFWNIRLYADGSAETHWGRVGEAGQRKLIPVFSEAAFDSKCREKVSGGYKPQKTVGGHFGTIHAANDALAHTATAQIDTNSPETLALVAYLASVNIHRILESTTLQYDAASGTFSTPLGIVTQDALEEARKLLACIGAFVFASEWDNEGFVPLLNDYLMLIPQNIGRGKPDPQRLFPDGEAVRKQVGILDSLEASLQAQPDPAAAPDAAPAAPAPRLFEARLHLCQDAREIARITAKYRATLQASHYASRFAVRRVYRVEIAAMNRAFDETGRKAGNIQELWHGTRAGNLLSLLKSGFVIPPSNAPHCTGRMFGNGVYFSDQSTKSLNYAAGYWSGRAENRCFMFLCDVAMGKSYTPQSWQETLPHAGFDSTWAKPDVSGVANNEMIVYTTDRIAPRFLVEFGPVDDREG